jgi:hypothetical protein
MAAAATPLIKIVFQINFSPVGLLLQGEVANIIAQLSAGNFKWQEFVMGLSMLAFLISLKHIQRK